MNFPIFSLCSHDAGVVPRLRAIAYNAMRWPDANDPGATRLSAGDH